MIEKITGTIKKYNQIESGETVIVGVSGGPDSICLLHILNSIKQKLNFNIIVAHINHKLRSEADEEENYVKAICKNLEIPFYSIQKNALEYAKLNKMSTEEAGREIRYIFFEEILHKTNANKIATAHNSNDNAETVIMNILRGCGVNGLKGIEPNRNNTYIRPIIECNRLEIEQYCNENNLNPRYDKTNKENIYTRNSIRNELIPYIDKKFNVDIKKAINKLSSIAEEEVKYIEKLIEKIYNGIIIQEKQEEIILDLEKFNKLKIFEKQKIIFLCIKKIFGASRGIEQKHIEDIIKLCENNIGNKYIIPQKKIKILVKSKKIFFILQKNGEVKS